MVCKLDITEICAFQVVSLFHLKNPEVFLINLSHVSCAPPPFLYANPHPPARVSPNVFEALKTSGTKVALTIE